MYDYTNDLAHRDVLERLTDLGEEVRRKVAALVSEADAVFLESTIESEHPIVGDRGPKHRFWWYFRIPKRMGEELTADLRSSGII